MPEFIIMHKNCPLVEAPILDTENFCIPTVLSVYQVWRSFSQQYAQHSVGIWKWQVCTRKIIGSHLLDEQRVFGDPLHRVGQEFFQVLPPTLWIGFALQQKCCKICVPHIFLSYMHFNCDEKFGESHQHHNIQCYVHQDNLRQI